MKKRMGNDTAKKDDGRDDREEMVDKTRKSERKGRDSQKGRNGKGDKEIGEKFGGSGSQAGRQGRKRCQMGRRMQGMKKEVTTGQDTMFWEEWEAER